MSEQENNQGFGSAPPSPSSHQKKKGSLKITVTIVIAIIGLIASASTVVALVQGWFDPGPSLNDIAEQQANIEEKLAANNEDTHLVNQVSRRVVEFGDQYQRLQKELKDIRRLNRSLKNQSNKTRAILTEGQKQVIEASIKKEREELLSKLLKTEKSAQDFIVAVESDSTLSKVETTDSKTAQTKTKAIKQANIVKNKILPELINIRKKHES